MIYVARVLYPVRVLGPGDRVGIWFNGCIHKCKGCSNPELWEQNTRYRLDVNVLINMIKDIVTHYKVDGFTLTGGDPFLQAQALEELLPFLKEISNDILVYTGYKYEELKAKYPTIVDAIPVLIDGPYIEERNNDCPLRGSDNQRIIYSDKIIESKYEEYLCEYKNQIQNFSSVDGIISVGIHRPDYNENLKHRLNSKGVVVDE